MPSSIRGRGISPTRSWTLSTKYLIICSVTSKSLMTPSRSGRIAMMLAGVRPTIRFASAPIARTRFVLASIATTDGSLITIPRSRTWTRVLAVPRSIPMSREKRPRKRSSMTAGRSFAVWGRAGSQRLRGRARADRALGVVGAVPRPVEQPAQYTRGRPDAPRESASSCGWAVRAPVGRRRRALELESSSRRTAPLCREGRSVSDVHGRPPAVW